MKKVTIFNLATGEETTVETGSEMYAVQEAHVAAGHSWEDAYNNTRHSTRNRLGRPVTIVNCGDFSAIVQD